MVRTLLASLTLTALLGSSIGAQQPEGQPPVWRAVAAALPPDAPVEIRLKDGRQFRGTLVEQRPEVVLFKPSTRRPVPAVEIAFVDIASIAPRKPGMSAGKKVVIVVATGAAAVTLAVLAIAATAQ